MADPARIPKDQRRLIAALGYVFTPVVPVIVLTSDLKDDARLRRHAGQALLWALPFFLLFIPTVIGMIALIRWSVGGLICLPIAILLPFAPGAIWGLRLYSRGDVTIPLLSHLGARLFAPR